MPSPHIPVLFPARNIETRTVQHGNTLQTNISLEGNTFTPYENVFPVHMWSEKDAFPKTLGLVD